MPAKGIYARGFEFFLFRGFCASTDIGGASRRIAHDHEPDGQAQKGQRKADAPPNKIVAMGILGVLKIPESENHNRSQQKREKTSPEVKPVSLIRHLPLKHF
jgi:hypothetical protein